jgi:hypothetical protein
MAITLTCVGCGKYFEGDKELVPEFSTPGGIGRGGHMCSECFALTNSLRASAGQSPMPTPPAGAWGPVGGELTAPPPTALRSAPTPQRQQVEGLAPSVQTARGQQIASKLPLANVPPSKKPTAPR